jgi:MFS family permease
MQIARGKSPTESGLLTIPMVIGLFAASTVIGRRVSRTGRYKPYMLAGTILLTLGLALMGTLDETTSLAELGAFMVMVGAGLGMLMQNLVLVVQNAVPHSAIGSGSSLIAFFRSMGGAVGVSVLGALLAHKVTASLPAGGGHSVPSVQDLPPAAVRLVEHAYGSGIAEIFLAAAPLGLIAMIAVALMREEPLGTRSGIDIAREAQPQAA